MLDKVKEQELRDMVTIKDKWYHKIPYIGKKIHSKQVYRLFASNKSKIYKTITEEVNKEIEKNNPNLFNQFAEASNVMLDNVKQMTIKNKNLDKYENICKTISL